MKAGPFMTLKYVPVTHEDARGGQRAGGRRSRSVRVFQSSSHADPGSPRSFRATGPSVRYARGYLVSSQPAVKRSSSGNYPLLSGDLEGQLSDLPEAAAEFGIPEPSASLVEEARRILSELWPGSAVKRLVYLMPDGSLAVDIRGKRPDGIFIGVRGDGSAQCSGEIGVRCGGSHMLRPGMFRMMISLMSSSSSAWDPRRNDSPGCRSAGQ